jgi:hypothetical protein
MARPNERNQYKEEIIEAWNTNERTADIAKRLDISKESILRTIKEENLPVFRRESFKPYPTKIDNATKDIVADLYLYRKIKPEKIAKKLNIHTGTVFKIIRERKLTNIRPPIGNDRRDIIDYYNNCKNVADTATHFKRSYTAISDFLKRKGINTSKSFMFYTFDWTSIDILALLKKHKGSLNAIQKETKIPWHWLDRYVKENNIPIDFHRQGQKFNPSDILVEEISNFYHKGATGAEIQKIFQLSKYHYKQIIQNHMEKRRPIRIPIEQYKDFISYSKNVRRLSLLIRTYINKQNYGNEFHWNHKVSVVDSFLLNLSVDVASCFDNQELISSEENLSIGWRSKITVDDLYLLRGTRAL